MENRKTEIAIIGAGAAGLMCGLRLAESLGEHQANITIYEKNSEIGKKIRISGGGRCNFTTGREEKSHILEAYIRGSEFLKYGIGKYSPKKIREFFAFHGVESRMEDDGRVFPMSNKSGDIVGVFECAISTHNHLNLSTKMSLRSLKQQGEQFELIFGTNEKIGADVVVLTTGGNAYAHTGSNGDGYEFARSMDHTITPLSPSLNSFETLPLFGDFLLLQGVALKKVVFRESDKKEVLCTGDMIFTHFGISGPGVFALAASLAYREITPEHTLKLILALTSENFEQVEQRLIKILSEHPKKTLGNILHLLIPLPERFSELLWKDQKIIHLDRTASTVSREERKYIIHTLLSSINITLTKRRPGDEFVTAGGIDTDEVSNKTCESKITPNLYFAGEILNIDGITGGFNFQSCWVTASLVSDGIIEKMKKE
ncbi:MAG: aminoacetone oxidase family FAD-binding enzyme [Candidatus Gracilibacteria bacterium]